MTPKMKATLDEEIREAARKLFLSSSVADLCKNEATPKQEEFLLHVFQAELAAREENKRHRLMKRAGFPTYKTFEGYEYGHIQFPPLFSREELESCQFIREHKNLILYGPVGTGKTHLAIAIGVKACQMGLKTKFFSVTELVLKLAEARKQGTLEKLVKDLQKQDLLTTNLEFSKWGSVFTDEQMAAAMIDRLAHHGHLLMAGGRSYRMEHALMRQDAVVEHAS